MKFLKKMSSVQVLALGYIVIILTGTFLLSLPIASREGQWTNFVDAFFTAGSATCVTGLAVFDTYTQWSLFGQIILLILIQIGGIGFMSVITLMSLVLRRHIGLYERTLIMQSAGALKMSGLVQLIKRIVIGTLVFELLGACLLSIRFIPDFGWARGVYYAIFHSVSAFCNAGFDLLGYVAPGMSLIPYASDVLVNLTVMFLIFMGGIGFIVWSDIWETKFRFKRLSLHSKIALIGSGVFILAGWGLFFLFERSASMKDMTTGNAVLASLFQSVSPRTAGFATVNQAALSESGSILTIFFMLIGGSSGGTAGGVKITTFVVLMVALFSSIRHNGDLVVGKKRLEESLLRKASMLLMSYLTAVALASVIICSYEPFTLKEVIFEVVSAIGTVGLSMGITPSLHSASKIILILLMYMGRMGALSLTLAVAEKRDNAPLKRPIDKILIG